MKAHDFIQPKDRLLTSKGLWFGGLLSVVKVLKCIGVYVINDVLKYLHIIQLFFLIKVISSLILLPLQKPFSTGRKLKASEWAGVLQYSVFSSIAHILWLYGITVCGPVRAILIFEHSSIVILAALSAVFTHSGSPVRVRGSILLCLGFISLMFLDKDATIPHVHSEKHAHHTGLNHIFYHVVNWFGVADHKAGVAILILALLLKVLSENYGRKLSGELGGLKRLYALSNLVSANVTFVPALLISWMTNLATSWSWAYVLLSSIFIVFLVFLLDFYGESACSGRLDALCLARFFPILMFITALVLSYIWFEPYRTASPADLIHGHLETIEHGFSGGLIFTIIFFTLAVVALTTGERSKVRAGQFVGYSTGGLPLYVYGEDFLQKTSQSVVAFAKNTLRQVLANRDSRRIFYFLCLNLVFTFVEFTYGIFTNSLGLISDAFHMFFDCSALVIGLVAAVMSSWPRTRQFSYGYGRIEILSGFTNGLFLIVIACFIFCEAFKRMMEPPEIHTEKLLIVSVAGLLVNLFGIAVFHGHGHSHSGSPAPTVPHTNSHGHSHDPGHGHSHSHAHSPLPFTEQHSHSHHGHSHNANMQGVFLHVLADTFGSVGVIISTLLIYYFGWHIADPICSLILSVLIFVSVLPLLSQSMSALVLNPDTDVEHGVRDALSQVLRLEGVCSYSGGHLWQMKSDTHIATLHIQITNDSDQQIITQQVLNILKCAGVSQAVVQVEKELFQRTIYALCPSYETQAIVSAQYKRPFQESLLVKSI